MNRSCDWRVEGLQLGRKFLALCSFFIIPCSLFLVARFLFLVPCSLFLIPCSLLLIPCSLFLVPCSLFFVPCSSFFVPCSLFLLFKRDKAQEPFPQWNSFLFLFLAIRCWNFFLSCPPPYHLYSEPRCSMFYCLILEEPY